MSLHFQILLWLAIIFIVAGAIILTIMLKTKKEERKESYLVYCNILDFWICYAYIHTHFRVVTFFSRAILITIHL